MNIDLAALRALEREREIPFDTILAAIETALLTAYRHTEGANPHARVEIDRKSGVATVYAQELDDDGSVVREYDDTPHDFGRIAAMTAKQVILQRLREATDEAHFGEYAGRDGDLVTGVIQAHEARSEKGIVTIDLGKIEAMLPPAEQVPGERTSTASGSGASSCTWPRASAARRSPCPGRTRTWCKQAVRAGGAGDRRRHRRDRRDRPGGRPPHEDRGAVRRAPGVNAKGACIGPMGAAYGGDERAARREDRHHRLVGRSGDVRRQCAVAGAGAAGRGRGRGRTARRGSPCRTSSCRWRSAGRARTPGSPPGSPAGGSTSGRTRGETGLAADAVRAAPGDGRG